MNENNKLIFSRVVSSLVKYEDMNETLEHIEGKRFNC